MSAQNARVLVPAYTLLEGQLFVQVLQPGDTIWSDYGLQSRRQVTAAALAALIAIMQNGSATIWQNFKYHATGTGNTPESGSDTALVTEVESRVVGTQTTAGTGVYKTVGVVTYTATRTIREHGVFSAASGTTLLDRSVLATPVSVINGTQVQFDYRLTISGL
jgi:hypothetical protein